MEPHTEVEMNAATKNETNFRPTRGYALVDIFRDAITYIERCQEGDAHRDMAIELYLAKVVLNMCDYRWFEGAAFENDDLDDATLNDPIARERWRERAKQYEVQRLQAHKQSLAEMRGLMEMLEKKYDQQLREWLSE
jgi:hypothetical protein